MQRREQEFGIQTRECLPFCRGLLCLFCGRACKLRVRRSSHFFTAALGILLACAVVSAQFLPQNIPAGMVPRKVIREYPGKTTEVKRKIARMQKFRTIPSTAVIWNRTGPGTYFWETPKGLILSFIPNGSWVILSGNWSGSVVPYGEAAFSDAIGWLDMRDVHRLPRPSEDLFRVAFEAGVHLYDEPRGPAGFWLSPGTPLLAGDVSNPGGWQRVRLLVGGHSGWVPTDRLESHP